MSRHQEGYIWRVGRSWFGRWREDVVSDGTIQDYKKRLVPKGRIARVQHSEKLAEHSDHYRRVADVRPLLADKLRPLNERKQSPESTLTLARAVRKRVFFCRRQSGSVNPRPLPDTRPAGICTCPANEKCRHGCEISAVCRLRTYSRKFITNTISVGQH